MGIHEIITYGVICDKGSSNTSERSEPHANYSVSHDLQVTRVGCVSHGLITKRHEFSIKQHTLLSSNS